VVLKEVIKVMDKEIVIVTEADFRTSLSVIRSLGEKNIKVVSIGKSRKGGLVSKYSSVKIIVNDERKYLDSIISIYNSYDGSYVFPHLEETYLNLYKYKIKNVIAPSFDKAEQYTNKKYVIEHIIHQKLAPIPDTSILAVNEVKIEELLKYIEDALNFHQKIIIKTSREIGITYGPFNRYVVIHQKNREILYSENFIEFLKKNREIILQKYVDGYGVGIGGVWCEGKPICVGGHRRIIQSHGSEGISVLAESYINKEAMKYALQIMESLDYTGIALVEFRYNEATGEVNFMEINPRIWGTLPLYIYAGLDIPYIAYKLFKYGDKSSINLKFQEGKRMFFFTDYVLSSYERNGKQLNFKLMMDILKTLPMFVRYKEGVLQLSDINPFLFEVLFFIKKAIRRIV